MKLHRKDFGDVDKITLCLIGDLHLGSKQHDSKLHKKMVEYCLENEIYVIGMGDDLETATKDSVGAGIFEQDDIVQGQLSEYIERMRPLADAGLLLGLHIGNHEMRVFKHSGTNLTKIMCDMLGVKYFGNGVLHYFKVGSKAYELYTTHGSSGSRLPHTKIKACIDLANMADVDIYCMGHVHALAHHTRQYYKVNRRAGTVIEAEKHFILTGSYLDHFGSYAMEKGMEAMKKGSPLIELGGLEKTIKVSL